MGSGPKGYQKGRLYYAGGLLCKEKDRRSDPAVSFYARPVSWDATSFYALLTISVKGPTHIDNQLHPTFSALTKRVVFPKFLKYSTKMCWSYGKELRCMHCGAATGILID